MACRVKLKLTELVQGDFLGKRAMNWIQRKIYLYNVTFGLYMLDWWERYLFNILVIVLMWFIFYNSSRYVTEYFKGYDTLGLHSNMFSRASDSTTETVTNSL